MKLLIKNAKVICPVQNIDEKKDILIEDGLIKELAKPGTFSDKDADKVIDATGMTAAPGLVDMHTHLREPGHEGAETIATGTLAAASGGFTSVAAMPNTHPVNDNPYVTAYMKTKAKEEGVIKVYPIGAITEKQEGTQLAEIGEMIKAGIVAVSDDGKCVMNSYVMRKAMDYCKQFNIPVIDHCEDTNLKGEGVMNEGYYSMKLGLRGIPSVSEEIMVSRDIALSHHTGCRTHIAHVSCAGSVRVISEAKKAGIPITAEATPHHLFLTEEAVATYDPNTKMSPPLRTKDDTKALRLALKNGTIDAIATDHAPHSIEKKDIEFQLSKNGIIGLETSFAWCLKLVHDGELTLMQLIKLMSTNPAKILGLNAGSLEKAKPADVVLFNTDEEWTYAEDKILSKSKNTPLKGQKFKGRVKYTICDGKIVWQG
ncbi:MAG: dihydroorotase [Pseudomonadota bacterium]